MIIWTALLTSLHSMTETLKTGNKCRSSTTCATLILTSALLLSNSHELHAASKPVDKSSPISFDLGGRARYESVDFSGDNGSALTTKLRLRTTYKKHAWTVHSEIDYVESFLTDNHSNGVTRTTEPVIADPRGFDLNQLYFHYKHNTTELVIGRQDIVFEDQRLIGDLGFRQNSQSFDGIKIKHAFVSGWKVDYAYVNQVNRLFGRQAKSTLSRSDIRFNQLGGVRPTAQLGAHQVDGHFLHVAGKVHDYLEVFAIGQSLHNSDHSPFSNRTLMVGADASYKSGQIRWQSSLIFAKQKKHETSMDDWLSFSRVEIGATKGKVQLSFRQERFGTSKGQSFITPMATLHKFQGWADRFLSTPSTGLTDNSILLRFRQLPFIVDARYHRYRSVASQPNTSRDIGDEFNLDLIYRIKRDHEVTIRYADFEPENSVLSQVPVKKLFLAYTYKL